MDLQNLIRQKKQVLKPCWTIVTNTDGRKFETKGNVTKEVERGLPFIVDNKPDMQIAMVAPGLYLSSQDPTSNSETLECYQIRHILSLGIEPSIKFKHIGYSFVKLMDLPESDITEAVKTCSQIIDQHKKDNILVHCNAGISRSATIVISYLMLSEKISYEDAFNKVKMVRNCIRPNEGFVTQLKNMNLNSADSE